MLPHVVRWNARHVGVRYEALFPSHAGRGDDAAAGLVGRLHGLVRAAGLSTTLRELGVQGADIEALAADAATQWTGTCNPRPFDAQSARTLYESAY
jgi:alcohol dehydrogenase class IV